MNTAVLIFAVSCLSLCYANTYNLEEWGTTNGKLLGTTTLFVPSEPHTRQIRTVAFTVVSVIFLKSFAILTSILLDYIPSHHSSHYFYRMTTNRIL